MLTVGTVETQGLGSLCCMVLEESVKITILSDKPYKEGLVG